MNAEIRVANADKGGRCYECREPARISCRPRDTDDPSITPEADEWYPMGLLSCLGCLRKIITILLADPHFPEHEADLEEERS